MDNPAASTTIRILRDEHQRLAAVIKAMRHFTRLIATEGKAPDLKVFRAMLLYISEYPERAHHPKEDKYLFEPLRRRTSDVNDTIDMLEAQHAEGEKLVRELEHALTRYELLGQKMFAPFHTLVEQYASLYFQHMNAEEEVILPAAERYLKDEDWESARTAFAANHDPLTGFMDDDDFDKLFSLITSITPAPLGVGTALE